MPRVLPRIELMPEDEARLRERVRQFLSRYRAPALVITTGLDGKPRFRLMGVRLAGFTPHLVSIKPSAKLQELQRTPEVTVLWYQYDADDEASDQPLRLVAITGEAEVVLSPAGIRAFPGPDQAMSDDELAQTRFGVIVHPTRIRVEGFLPGPRYPVFLRP